MAMSVCNNPVLSAIYTIKKKEFKVYSEVKWLHTELFATYDTFETIARNDLQLD